MKVVSFGASILASLNDIFLLYFALLRLKMHERLLISAVLKFNSFHSSYCVRQAEAILAANRLIRCGVKPRQHDEIVVEGMCLQSNSTNYPPRTITAVF